jgi:hypothetical protein
MQGLNVDDEGLSFSGEFVRLAYSSCPFFRPFFRPQIQAVPFSGCSALPLD